MASPGDKKGQRRSSCGHIMVSFDNHKKCARCREKRIGDDPCVDDEACEICDSFTETQKDMLATLTYRIRKDKKSSFLVSPDEVTVIASVEETNKTWNLLFNLLLTTLLLLPVMLVVHLLHLINLNKYQISGQNSLLVLRLYSQEGMFSPHLKPQLNQCHHTLSGGRPGRG